MKIKKKYLLGVAVAATVISACTNEEIANKLDEGSSSNAIEFRTLTDKTQGRAITTDNNNILSFSVTAWWDEGKSYLFNGYDITRSAGIKPDGTKDGVSWSYSPTRHWPGRGEVSFFAYSPASSVNVVTDLRQSKPYPANFDFPTIEYEVPNLDPAAGKLPEDFLVAVNYPLTDADGTVSLDFKHVLSKVKFNAIKKNDLEYIVYGVKLVNLKSRARLYLKKSAATTGSTSSNGIPGNGQSFAYNAEKVVLWKEYTSDTKDYGIDMGGSPFYVLPGDYGTSKGHTLLGDNNALMVMPQETVPGEVEKATEVGDINQPKTPGAFYIVVSYKAFFKVGDNMEYYAGTADEPTDLYLPVKNQVDPSGTPFYFEAGRSYTFNLEFGTEGSTSGDGSGIKFDVSTTDWAGYDANKPNPKP